MVERLHLADQSPNRKNKTRLLDLAECDGRIDVAPKAEIGHRQFRVLGIVAATADHVRQTYYSGFSHAMVEEHAITGFHVANSTQSLRIPDAIPDGLAIALQLFHGIRLRVRLCQKIRQSAWYSLHH